MAMKIENNKLYIYPSDADIVNENRMADSSNTGTPTCSLCPIEDRSYVGQFYDFLGLGHFDREVTGEICTNPNEYQLFHPYIEGEPEKKWISLWRASNERLQFVFDKLPIYLELNETKKYINKINSVINKYPRISKLYVEEMSTFKDDSDEVIKLGRSKLSTKICMGGKRPYVHFSDDDGTWKKFYKLIYSEISTIVVEKKIKNNVESLYIYPLYQPRFGLDYKHLETNTGSLNFKNEFKCWLSKQQTKKGTPWSDGAIAKCVSVLGKGFNEFDKYEEYDSFFEIVELLIFNEYQAYLNVQDGVAEFDVQEKGWFYKGLEEYELFLQDYEHNKFEKLDKITYETSCADEIILGSETIKFERNRIFFGAPGTGKSFELDKQTKIFAATSYERVTFHPEYTHSAFFGTYKPVPNPNDRDKITYAFIPGPFLRVLSKALINANVEINPHPFVLLIEEINRANMAAVFGEVFQLLDRDDNNVSKYSISPSEDVKKYLVDEFAIAGINIEKEAFNELRIPNNMFIWASMNSADQGVFPMDTAFKRRWDFEYFNIDQNKDVISSYTFNVAGSDINWNSLRKAINQRLTELRINEDKLMGPFFIGTSVLESGDDTKIINTIKNKVIMYLFEDAARQKRKDVFVKGFEKTYSQICNDFETNGLKIFTQEIIDFYNKNIK